ncbi:inositol polyphosphate multikinase-like [Mytilus californianus]|uniref:inositol polyphosphate multikinase-like n=1 Tax=Mytilus californianus TaxID=6549 RepID=UPI002247EDEA|nr:inositol polyphosphate multikinase-like [Mytilus californianus]XP_052069130.1 inositol polyphosphate multikinase-like [Mytilus californianus]
MSKFLSSPQLPPGTKPLPTQVAGHKYGDGNIGCLEVDDGTILKLVQNPPNGQRELDFYDEIFKSTYDNTLIELRSFVPEFHGVIHGETNGGVAKHQYLKLENLIKKLSKPCVLDIKMGRKTYDPEASPEKVASQIAKFPPVLQLGYQFTGMLKFDTDKNKMVKYDKYFCRKLTEKTMLIDGLGEFFRQGKYYRKDYIQAVVDKLKSIETWFLNQKKYAFYASSLLLVYNASVDITEAQDIVWCSEEKEEKLDSMEDNKIDLNYESDINQTYDRLKEEGSDETGNSSFNHNNPDRSFVDVRMIDFTHVFPSEDRDENYIFGLQNLIKHLQSLLDM